MSIINATILPGDEAALLAVDSAGVSGHGTVFDVSKLIALPHCDTVVGFRGTLAHGINLYRQLVGHVINFEILSAGFADLLMRAIADTVNEAETVGMDLNAAPRAEAVVVGYSPMAGRVVIHHFRHDGGTLVEHRDIRNVVAPWENAPACSLDGIGNNRAGLIELSRRQVAIFADQFPGAMGGDLYIAEVRCGSISIERAATLTDRISINPKIAAWVDRRRDGFNAAIAEAL